MSPAAFPAWRLMIAVVMLVGLLPAAPAAAQDVPNVLVHSTTYGFRHTSIETGNQTLQELADSTGAFTVEMSDLNVVLATGTLADYDMVLFNSTTGRFPLTAAEKALMEQYWSCGGGTVGIHAASDANYGWPAYAELMGAQFDAHPHGAGTGEATFSVENADHPVNAAYADAATWAVSDELYEWKRDARGTQDVVPLLSLQNDSSPQGDAYVADQPLSFVKTFRGAGRVYNNNFGHNEATWGMPAFQQSLVDGITWVAETSLDTACFGGDPADLPGPAAPAQEYPTEENPREACVVPDGAIAINPADGQITYDAGHTAVPAYFGKTVQTVVVDLTGYDHVVYADLAVTHAWPNAIDDYDLSITTPWGFAGSGEVQPASDPIESDVVENAVHCAEIRVDVYNHAAFTGDAGTVTLELDPQEAPPAPPAAIAPIPGQIVTGPAAQTTGFLPSTVVLTVGSSLTLTNYDTVQHSVVCGENGRADGNCYSTLAGTAGGTTEVKGQDTLPPGTYPFFCGIHPEMKGEMVIV